MTHSTNANPKTDFNLMMKAGDFMFATSQNNEPSSLLFICPCGCGKLRSVALKPRAASPSWDWNGDKEKPSLTPSINCLTGCQWHGWLTNGVFTSC